MVIALPLVDKIGTILSSIRTRRLTLARYITTGTHLRGFESSCQGQRYKKNYEKRTDRLVSFSLKKKKKLKSAGVFGL